ncbi:MAG TPA: TauD/TfdA family dioxygenase [Pyrinomonadaceae bacterium]|jgi:alpha-ketoglutarate-dependent taurine dioxygenase
MTNSEPKVPELRKPGAARRKPVSVSPAGLVTEGPLAPGAELPLVIRPAVKGVDLAGWAARQREFIEAKLLRHGGLLFRGFGVRTPEAFEGFIRAVSGEPLEYRERSSPRSQVSGNIYTSTDHPASQSIFLHNENSYQHTWPLKVYFCCAVAAERQGETPIADVRRVYARISPETRERFRRRQWMYVRNFGDGLGLPWQTVFQTEDPAAVEEHCRRNGIRAEWKEGGRLRTRAVRPALARHPKTGEVVWFNHATFFHVTTLDPSVRDLLREEFADDDLPTNTCYGDGSPIEDEVLEELRRAYREETVCFPWEEGDVMLLDNMLVAHGRSPYAGRRQILVGMAEPCGDRGL